MKGFDHKSGSTLSVRGAEIYFEERGRKSDPVLLFLHGGMGNIEDLNGIISKLPGACFRIVGIDNRGHGRSTLGPENLSYELLQEEVEFVLTHLQIKRFSVIGFSNGGTVAYRLAACSKMEVDRLITIGAPWSTRHIEPMRESFSKLTSEVWKQQCPSDYLKFKKLSPESDFDQVFKQVLGMALDVTQSRPDRKVKSISCPVLALRGENDPVVSEANLDELSTLIQNVKVISVPGAGHEVFLDELPGLMTHINAFLSLSDD